MEKPPHQQILQLAKEVIEKRGWVQNSFSNNEGVCAMMAMEIACAQSELGKDKEYHTAIARERLKDVIGIPSITEWNDNHIRTKEQVLDAFEKAALLT